MTPSAAKMIKVKVYDFDNTLVNTPNRENAEIAYLAATGEPWPFVGYYGRVESLMPPVFPEIPDASFLIPEVRECYLKDEPCRKVLLTGRPMKMRSRVKEICIRLGCDFDDWYLRGHWEFYNRGDTLEFKKSVLLYLLKNHEILEMWEDRQDHYDAFSAWFDELRQENPALDITLRFVGTLAAR